MTVPPTLVTGVTPLVGWSSNASAKTSPAFDVQNGDLIVLIAFTENTSRTLNAPTWTGSGAWTLNRSLVLTGFSPAYLFTCVVTATDVGRTISVSAAKGNSQQWSFFASVWRNHGGLGVSDQASANPGAPALPLGAAANSALVFGSSDWFAVDGSARVWRSVNGVPITETSYGGDAGKSYICYTGYAPDTGPAGIETVGLLSPASQKYSIVGIEILGSNVVVNPALPVQLVQGGVVHPGSLFYWDGSAKHELNLARSI